MDYDRHTSNCPPIIPAFYIGENLDSTCLMDRLLTTRIFASSPTSVGENQSDADFFDGRQRNNRAGVSCR